MTKTEIELQKAKRKIEAYEGFLEELKNYVKYGFSLKPESDNEYVQGIGRCKYVVCHLVSNFEEQLKQVDNEQ